MLKLFISDDVSIISIVIFFLMLVVIVWLGFFIYKAFKQKAKKDVALYPNKEFDGIKEGDAPIPFGFHILMILGILFALWYIVIGYPLTKKLSASWYADSVMQANQLLDQKFANADDQTLIQMGESVFNANCTACHGINGRGLSGVVENLAKFGDKAGITINATNGNMPTGIAANLVEFGTEAHVIYTIKNGSKGLKKITPIMPPQWPVLGATEEERQINATNVAAYVLSLSGKKAKKGDPALGKPHFDRICAACHFTTGEGTGPGGDLPNFAANLTEYGTTPYIKKIVEDGKDGIIGVMPSFKTVGTLSDLQLKAVSLYVERSLRMQ